MARKNGNLKLVGQQDEKAKQRQQEEEAWKLTRDEAAARVREVRSCLEAFSNRLAGVQFDLGYDTPPCLEGMDNPYIAELAERLNPFIAGYSDRIEQRSDEYQGDDLQELKLVLGETAFAIGVMAGAIFHGASRREIDRLERGLVHATMSRHWQVKA